MRTVKEGRGVTLRERIVSSYRRRKRKWILFILLNTLLLLGLVLFPAYCKYMWEGPGKDSEACKMIKYLHLYCPSCGCTRSLWYLLHLNFIKAFVYSPFMVVSVAIFAYCDIRAAISLLKDQDKIIYLNAALAAVLVGTLIGGWIIRNLLLVFTGYDPLGDIGQFWKIVISVRS